MNKTIQLFFVITLMICFQGCAGIGENMASATGGKVMQERESIHSAVQQIVDAYQQKNLRAVVANIADDFNGEQSIFEDSIRKDFSLHNDIRIRYTLDNVTPDEKGRAFAVVTFTRTHMDIQSTKVVTNSGSAEMVFKRKNGVYQLWSIKPTALFGLDK